MVKRWIASLDGWPEKKVGQIEVVRASDYDKLQEEAKELARLLKYAHAYSSYREYMPDGWKEDTAKALSAREQSAPNGNGNDR